MSCSDEHDGQFSAHDALLKAVSPIEGVKFLLGKYKMQQFFGVPWRVKKPLTAKVREADVWGRVNRK